MRPRSPAVAAAAAAAAAVDSLEAMAAMKHELLSERAKKIKKLSVPPSLLHALPISKLSYHMGVR